MGSSICSLVFDTFHHPRRITGINQTLIAIIPKVNHPKSVKQFRLISVLNWLQILLLINSNLLCLLSLPLCNVVLLGTGMVLIMLLWPRR